MTLIGRSGSFEQTSSQSTALKETDRVQPDNVLAATDKDVVHLQHIEDTFATRTAINASRYSDEYAVLALFPEGSPIVVTYYHQNFSEIDIRSMPSDISTLGHPVHTDFTKIMQFEMRLLAPLSSDYDTGDNSFNVTGEAVMYPGFEPSIGDEFFLEMGDGKIGEFKINDITPMSYRQGKYHKVSIELLNYVTAAIKSRLDAGVRDVLYFDKNVYVGNGDYTFLTAESYVQLQTLQKKRKELLQYYTNRFYDEAWESYIRPDGIYDPYIVEFIRARFSVKDVRIRPRQLYSRLTDYHKSFWYMLTDSVYTDSMSFLTSKTTVQFMQAEALATDHNALLNRYYILLGETAIEDFAPAPGFSLDPTLMGYVVPIFSTLLPVISVPITEQYVFSEHFYQGNIPEMTPLERMVYEYLTTRKINVASALNLITQYRTMSDRDQFYYIPILIELILASINALRQ